MYIPSFSEYGNRNMGLVSCNSAPEYSIEEINRRQSLIIETVVQPSRGPL
jgi:hypothetical protein